MSMHEKIDYVEFPARDLDVAKTFFAEVFDWKFTDYGSDYTAFFEAGLNGGFYRSDLTASTANGSALIVFHSKTLERTQERIERAGGSIIKPVFTFPGGRRFHFADPNGNEYAVWTRVPAEET
jgi:predicted enzyme related to lactoylglutathione lyase